MRAIDLLAFKVDDDHKKFIKQSPLFEKNYKIKKVFQAYSWGRTDEFALGFVSIKDEVTEPREINFAAENGVQGEEVSVRDVMCTDSYTLALSEQGQVYTWGMGTMGRLGNGSEQTEPTPHLINFDFTQELSKISRTKSLLQNTPQQSKSSETAFMRDFLKIAKSNKSITK
jgi:alpha-tubulin suppressor-like RCC1 family protein